MANRNIIIIMTLSVVLCASVAGGRTYYVDPNGSNNANGLSWDSAFKTIQKGIIASTDGDVVEVNEGTYYGPLYIGWKNITVRGLAPNDWDVVAATVIDGNGATDTVLFELTDANLIGFTVTGGSRGIHSDNGSDAAVRHCIITGNARGVVGDTANVTATSCIIRNNSDEGMFANYAGLIARSNFIYDNNEGITIIGPYTGGILRNNTIVNNRNYGIRCANDATVSIVNCIVWDNGDGNDISGCSTSYSCIKDPNDAAGNGNITSDPRFVRADNNDFHINRNSPCVNAGDPNEDYAGQVDIDGKTRVVDARIDIGADEINALPPDAKPLAAKKQSRN